MTPFFNYNPDNKVAVLALKVKANAKADKIGEFMIINDKHYLKLFIKSVPEDGKANHSIINFLSKKWKLVKIILR